MSHYRTRTLPKASEFCSPLNKYLSICHKKTPAATKHPQLPPSPCPPSFQKIKRAKDNIKNFPQILSSQPQASFHPPPNLATHSIPPAPRPPHRIAVLLRPPQQILHTLPGRPPHQILIRPQRLLLLLDAALLLLLIIILLGRQDLAAYLIRHTLQLRKCHLSAIGCRRRRRGILREENSARGAHRVGIMRRQHHIHGGESCGCGRRMRSQRALPGAPQQRRSNAVVARVRIGLGVVDEVARVTAQVRPAHELDAEHEALALGSAQVRGDDRGRGLEVGLVGAVDDGLVAGLVVLAHVVQRPVVDAGLHGLLLGVEEQAHAAGRGEVADLVDGAGERCRGWQALGKRPESLAACAGESFDLGLAEGSTRRRISRGVRVLTSAQRSRLRLPIAPSPSCRSPKAQPRS